MKKVLLLIITILAVFSVSGCEKKNEPAPQITEGQFPFVVEYEKDGKTYLIEDTVVCAFNGYDLSNAFSFVNSRSWVENLESGEEEKRLFIEFPRNTPSEFTPGRTNIDSRVILYYGSGGYYLGDPNKADRRPCIYYIEHYQEKQNAFPFVHTELSFEQLEQHFGIKIIRFEFSEPIENTFR